MKNNECDKNTSSRPAGQHTKPNVTSMVWFGKIDELNHYSAVYIHAVQRMWLKFAYIQEACRSAYQTKYYEHERDSGLVWKRKRKWIIKVRCTFMQSSECNKNSRIRIGLQNLQIVELTTAEPVCHSFWIFILPDVGKIKFLIGIGIADPSRLPKGKTCMDNTNVLPHI